MAVTGGKRRKGDLPKDTLSQSDTEDYEEKPGTNQIRLRHAGNDWYILGEPLYRTLDGRLVHENNPDGRQLYGGRGYRAPKAELVAGGALPADDEDEGKHAKKGE